LIQKVTQDTEDFMGTVLKVIKEPRVPAHFCRHRFIQNRWRDAGGTEDIFGPRWSSVALDLNRRLWPTPAEPTLYEGHNVVSEIFCVDAVRVPSPRLLSRIKNDQPFVREPPEKLNRKKRVSPGLLMQQFDQRVSTLGIDPKRIADKLRKVIKRKRRERHVSYLNALSFDSGQRLRQRME
jgi:hypothetical protein